MGPVEPSVLLLIVLSMSLGFAVGLLTLKGELGRVWKLYEEAMVILIDMAEENEDLEAMLDEANEANAQGDDGDEWKQGVQP